MSESGASGGSDSAFKDSSLTWQAVTKDIKIPRQFSIETITDYLRNIEVQLVCGPGNDSDSEDIRAGTKKPLVKGRQMYLSERLTLAEFAETPTHLYFRGNCEASMRKVMDMLPKKELHGQNPVVTYATKQVELLTYFDEHFQVAVQTYQITKKITSH